MTAVLDLPLTADAGAPVQPKERPTATKLVIFAWSGDLDRVWPTLILATTAAASGMPVTVFFTFWGLFPLVKDSRRITGESWMQKMLSVMNRPGLSHLPLSKMDFAGMGTWMMRSLARKNHVASPAELLDIARDLGVRLIPCQMTMDMMGISRGDLIDGLEEPAGAATALADAAGATTLFI